MGGPGHAKLQRVLSWSAASIGVVLLVASAAEWIRRGRAPRDVAAPPSVASEAPASSEAAPTASWPSLLAGPHCAAPCCGGEACAVDAANGRDYVQFCRPGTKSCLPCATGLTCIPGGCELELARGETWNLRVSAARSASSPSKTVCEQADQGLRVCVAKPGGAHACWTKTDICNAAGPLLAVTTDELMGGGIEVQIQDGNGKTVSKAHRAYGEGMRRRGLCTGYVVRGFGAKSPYAEVQFFLLP